MKNCLMTEHMINLQFSSWAVLRMCHLLKLFVIFFAVLWLFSGLLNIFHHSFCKGIRHRKIAEKAIKHNQKLVCVLRPLGYHDQSTEIVAYAISLRPNVYNSPYSFY